MHLDPEEIRVVELALVQTADDISQSKDDNIESYVFLRCGEYILLQIRALLARIEQHVKDEAEEKADG